MTTHHLSPRRGRAAAVTAVLFASLSVATISATTATAEPNGGPAKGYATCVVNQLMREGHDVNPTYKQEQEALFDCCIILEGQWVGSYPDGFCTWPDPADDNRPKPAPGRVASLPPGATTLQ